MNGPRPSKLVLLQDLYRQPLQSKVRFLGCVAHYDIHTGRLLLEYPLSTFEAAELAVESSKGGPNANTSTCTTTSPDSLRKNKIKSKGSTVSPYPENRVVAIEVDIGNILESIQRDDIQIGAWLNVFGYIRQNRSSAPDTEAVGLSFHDNSLYEVSYGISKEQISRNIYIDAVIVFPARAIRIDEYDRVVREAQEVDRRIRRPQ